MYTNNILSSNYLCFFLFYLFYFVFIYFCDKNGLFNDRFAVSSRKPREVHAWRLVKLTQVAIYTSRWTRRREEQVQGDRRWNGPDDGRPSRILSELTTNLLKLPCQFVKWKFRDENKISTYWLIQKFIFHTTSVQLDFFVSELLDVDLSFV